MYFGIAALMLALTLPAGLTHAGVASEAAPRLPACEAHLASLSVPHEWECLGEADLLSPDGDAAEQGWVLRAAWVVALRRAGTAQLAQQLYVDQETHRALYRQRFAADGTLESAVWVNAL